MLCKWGIPIYKKNNKKNPTILTQRNNERNNKPHNNIWHTILTYLHILITFELQKNLCNSTPELSDILWHPKRIYDPKVFLLTKLKPEYSDILYNPTHFPGPLVCWTINWRNFYPMLVNLAWHFYLGKDYFTFVAKFYRKKEYIDLKDEKK